MQEEQNKQKDPLIIDQEPKTEKETLKDIIEWFMTGSVYYSSVVILILGIMYLDNKVVELLLYAITLGFILFKMRWDGEILRKEILKVDVCKELMELEGLEMVNFEALDEMVNMPNKTLKDKLNKKKKVTEVINKDKIFKLKSALIISEQVERVTDSMENMHRHFNRSKRKDEDKDIDAVFGSVFRK